MTEPSELEKHLVQLRADHPDRCATVVRVRNASATPCSVLLEP